MQNKTLHTHKKNKWILLVTLTLVFSAPLFIWKGKQNDRMIDKCDVPTAPNAAGSYAKKTHSVFNSKNIHPKGITEFRPSEQNPLTMDGIKSMQSQAAHAAIYSNPIQGAVSRRPDFVSEIEWDVIKDALSTNEDRAYALSHVVNKLLFFKKRELWMNTKTAPVIRKKMARDLLGMIPAQVEGMAIDQKFADQLTADLNVFLGRSIP